MPTSSHTSLQDLAALNAELAALVRARIPLEASLRRLGKQFSGSAGNLANRLAERMERGASLSEAMDQEGPALPDVYKAVVAAGIASGNPAAALQAVSQSAARLASLRNTTGVALIVPVLVVCLASFLFGFLFTSAFSDAIWIHPPALQSLEAWTKSPVIRSLFLWVIPLTAMGVPLLWWLRSAYVRSVAAPNWSVFGWIPGARKLHNLNASATFAEVLRMGVAAGLPAGEALRAAGRASGSRRFSQAATTLGKAHDEGQTLHSDRDQHIARALDQLPPLVKVALKLIEHRQLLETAIDRAAQSYLRRADVWHTSLTDWIPASFTLAIAGSVTLAYTLALVWPYTEILKSMASAWWK
jgi:type II secretory pathway component PulF